MLFGFRYLNSIFLYKMATRNFSKSTTSNSVTVANTSTLVLAANPNRKYVALVNDSNEVIYISLGVAAVLNKGIRLNAEGGSYEIDSENLYTGSIYAICSSGSKVLTVTEG